MRTSSSTATAVDDYIAGFPSEVKVRLEAMRATIRRAAPEATERIAYGIPTFWLNGNLVHFAGFAHHIGFYPAPSGIEAFRARLAGYESAKGSVRFPHDEPLPLDLVAEIVAFRVTEHAKGERAPSGRKAAKRGHTE